MKSTKKSQEKHENFLIFTVIERENKSKQLNHYAVDFTFAQLRSQSSYEATNVGVHIKQRFPLYELVRCL